jgi:rare lipoprotein A
MSRAATTGFVLSALVAGCSAPPPPAPPAPPVEAVAAPVIANPVRFTETGIASFYGDDFNRKLTASGQHFNMNSLTAAHRTLPLNTRVRVTNLANGKSVVVRINDRGPYAKGRIIDLSAKAASDIGMTKKGITRVRLQVFDADQEAALQVSPRGEIAQRGR